MNPFLPFLITSFLAACGWTVLMMLAGRGNRGFLGMMGAWAATGVLAALWQAEAVPWLWTFPMGVLLLWLGAVGLLTTAMVSIWRVREPGRRRLLCCAVLGIGVNVAAGMRFLWLATVSPGGV